jgi:hypothetical protein
MKKQWLHSPNIQGGESNRPMGVRYLAGFVISVLAGFCVFQAWYILFHSSYFTVDKVVVRGAKAVNEAEVIRLSGIRKGSRSLQLDFEQVRTQIRKHPRVREARLLQLSPREIQIRIEEWTPELTVGCRSRILGMTWTGEIFPLKPDTAVSPRVRLGLSKKETLEHILAPEKQLLLRNWIKVLEASSLKDYDYLSIENLSRVYLLYQGVKILVDDLERFKLHEQKIPVLLHSIIKDGKIPEYIDMRFEDMVVKWV